ncbi:hypothetical protein DFH27DRAFT_52610 [Peziza echinospora]|nr:hypothetical protein DFH27DRAFT_52610 [Peziza echinospora]
MEVDDRFELTGFSGVYGNDSITPFDKTDTKPPTASDSTITIGNFPVYVVSEWDKTRQPVGPNSMGLQSSASTILDRLWAGEKIPGRGFGLQTGLYVPDDDERLKGELILGGYNPSRMAGQVHEYNITRHMDPHISLTSKSPFIVTVLEAALDFDGTGKNVTDLFYNEPQFPRYGGGLGFKAQLETRLPYIALPSLLAQNYRKATGGTTSDAATGFITPGKNFTAGFMWLKFDGGLEVRIPAKVLNQAFGDTGISAMREYQDFPGNSGDIPLLGAHFMSEVYMWADFERQDGNRAGVFGLANINRGGGGGMLTPICSQENAQTERIAGKKVNTTTGGGEGPPSGGSGGKDGGGGGSGGKKKKALQKDAIAGIAVGAAIVLIGSIYLLTRHRRKHRESMLENYIPPPVEIAGLPIAKGGGADGGYYDNGHGGYSGVPYQQAPPYESPSPEVAAEMSAVRTRSLGSSSGGETYVFGGFRPESPGEEEVVNHNHGRSRFVG